MRPHLLRQKNPKLKAHLKMTKKPKKYPAKSAPVTCSLCNVEMSQTKTKFKVEGWEGLHPKLTGDDSGKLEEEFLPAIVYLCPQCGKIEFKADEKKKKLAT